MRKLLTKWAAVPKSDAARIGFFFELLQSRGSKGLTQLEYSAICLDNPGLSKYFTRIAAVVHELRTCHKVKVETVREGRTNHARYHYVKGQYNQR